MVSKIIRVESEQLTLKHNFSHSFIDIKLFLISVFYFHFCVFRLMKSLWTGFPLFPTMRPVSTLPSLGLTSPWPRSTSLRWLYTCIQNIIKPVFSQDARIEISCVASIGSLRSVTNTGSASDAGTSWLFSTKTSQVGWSIWDSKIKL